MQRGEGIEDDHVQVVVLDHGLDLRNLVQVDHHPAILQLGELQGQIAVDA